MFTGPAERTSAGSAQRISAGPAHPIVRLCGTTKNIIASCLHHSCRPCQCIGLLQTISQTIFAGTVHHTFISITLSGPVHHSVLQTLCRKFTRTAHHTCIVSRPRASLYTNPVSIFAGPVHHMCRHRAEYIGRHSCTPCVPYVQTLCIRFALPLFTKFVH